jgi:hypothetical protein
MIKSANGQISHRPETNMNQKLIVIDGKSYKSVEEMPEDVRKSYEDAMRQMGSNPNSVSASQGNLDIFADKNNNGMPDAFDGMVANVFSATKIVADGKAYNSLDQLPPEVRAKYEQAMGAMDANKNGVPDFLEGMMNVPNQPASQAAASFATASPPPASPKPMPVGSTIEPESSGGWVLALTGILLIGLCLVAAAAGAWYFFLR